MSGDDARLRAWAYLAAVAEPPCAPLIALAERIGPEDAAQLIRARRLPAGGLLEATEARAGIDTAAEDLQTCAKIGARLVTRDDDDWPAWSLLALDRAGSAARAGAPLALWVRGPGPLTGLGDRAVSVVGSRAASSYGDYVAGRLSGELAARDRAVLSGGAYGIDGAAHRGALAAGGSTAAILACGIDRDYPSGHAGLLAEIARTGLVITEYAPGTTAAKYRFLTRNRLVAALAGAVVVVEAGRRSGAANTAAWARGLGRPLGAVPGPVTSATSVGCHQLIADGEAALVTDADAVLALIEPDGHDNHRPSAPRPLDGLAPDQLKVIEALPARGALGIDEIAFVSGLPTAGVRAALARLEVEGLIDGASGRWSLRPAAP